MANKNDDEPMGIVCPKCHCNWCPVHTTRQVTNSRIRRYRQCHHCKFNFSTTEIVNGEPRKAKKKKPPKANPLDDELYVINPEEDFDIIE